MALSTLIKAPTERQIQDTVLTYLENVGFYVWENKSIGVFDAKRGAFRSSSSEFNRKGVSDILGVGFNGRLMAIEMKTPKELTYVLKHYEELRDRPQTSKKRIHLQNQILFIENVRRSGGVAFFSDGINTTRHELRKADQINAQ